MARKLDPQTEFDVINQFAFLSSPDGVDALEKFKLEANLRLDNLLSGFGGDGIVDVSISFCFSDEDDFIEDDDHLTADEWVQVCSDAFEVADCASQSDQTIRVDGVSKVSRDCIVRPDADSTTRSASTVSRKTAQALESIQRRRSQIPSPAKLPKSTPPDYRSVDVKSSRGFILPNADTTVRSSHYKSQGSPLQLPLPLSKVDIPDESTKLADPMPRAKPSPARSSSGTGKLDRSLSFAVSEGNLICAFGGVLEKSQEVNLSSRSTPSRAGSQRQNFPSPNRRSPVGRSSIGSPLSCPSSPFMTPKEGKSPSKVLSPLLKGKSPSTVSSPLRPRLSRPINDSIISGIASKAASLKASVENGFGNKFFGEKGKRSDKTGNGVLKKQMTDAQIEVLPKKLSSTMLTGKRENTFTRDTSTIFPTEDPLGTTSKPPKESRVRRRSFNTGRNTSN